MIVVVDSLDFIEVPVAGPKRLIDRIELLVPPPAARSRLASTFDDAPHHIEAPFSRAGARNGRDPL
jgi:hypothetical protein